MCSPIIEKPASLSHLRRNIRSHCTATRHPLLLAHRMVNIHFARCPHALQTLAASVNSDIHFHV